MNHRKQIKIGGILSYASILLNVLVGFLCTPLIIKSLGTSSYGIYTLAFSVMNMFLIDFGLGSAASRYISKYRSENNQTAVNDVFGLILKLFIVLALLIGVFFIVWIFLSPHIYAGLSSSEIHSFQISFAIVSAYSLISFPFLTFDGILTAYEKFVQAKSINIISRLVLTTLILLSVFLNLGIYALIASHAIVGVIAVSLKFIFVYKFTPARPNLSFRNKSLLKDVTVFSSWVAITTLANRLLFNICPTIMGIVSGSNQIAIFGLIATVESYVYVFATAINGMFIATITRYFVGDNPIEKLKNLMAKVGKFQFFINGLIICGFAVLGLTFIKWWAGDDYSMAYYGIILVVVPGLFYNPLEIGITTMIVTKKVKYHAITEIIVGIINVGLCFPLAAKYGAIGACFSLFIALVIRTILTILICAFILKIPMKDFFVDVYMRMLLPCILTIGIGLLAIQNVGYVDKLEFIRIGLVIVTLYFILMFGIGLSSQDKKNLMSRILKGKSHGNK